MRGLWIGLIDAEVDAATTRAIGAGRVNGVFGFPWPRSTGSSRAATWSEQSPAVCLFLRLQNIVVVDPLTGQTLSVRRNIPWDQGLRRRVVGAAARSAPRRSAGPPGQRAGPGRLMVLRADDGNCSASRARRR